MKKVLSVFLVLAFLMNSASLCGVWAVDGNQTDRILQLSPTASWTLDGTSTLYYNPSGYLGGGQNFSWCSFSADFGTVGYDVISLSVASALGSSATFDIYIDNTLQTNMVRVATGSWTEPQNGEIVLDQTYTGTHTVKIAWKDNGNLFGIYFKNLNDASKVTATPSAQWAKSALNYNTSGNFGGASGISWCSFSVDFGTVGYNQLTLSVGSGSTEVETVGFSVYVVGEVHLK
jgi:hypothetical protein